MRPAGYTQLAKKYGLAVIAGHHESFIGTSGAHRTDIANGIVRETYPAKYWPGDGFTVQNDTADYYRYIDFTAQAEALFEFIRETIEVELVQELRFLANYDVTKRAIQEIVDMPDRLIDLFIRLCLQNRGQLSKRKRDDCFPKLTDDEVNQMEQAVQREYSPR